ncbi:BlaI/MecI/CopY family transcriptional regulator [Shewanella sp. C32]|uniref:BlaI/MecI/CopY family transcriptional regulator n=1 Tax=Shewanella electrica TaxID=515560 RepID=A0ABT2FKV0_9GAMM|nr:BlaI/MecI/CopY family transcriptional regulator [Shewanella electrica]MCH1923971.1 BlaI/MecI/CopY family transcriptional regulator [Shewanella electrica]MCS4555874.1 BlaI/MecI/CopY family transcriptional regulator [Shewanella electrica]
MKEISNAELTILNLLWQRAPQSAQEIIEQLASANDWQDKTVKTLLNRLVNKQAIGFDKQGRAYAYYPLIKQSEYQLKESESFIQRLFSGRVAPLVAGFAKQKKLTEQDVNELQQLIDQWKKDNPS